MASLRALLLAAIAACWAMPAAGADLPVDLELVLAVDVSGNTPNPEKGGPSTAEAIYGALQIMQQVISVEKLKATPVDVLIKPAVEKYRVFDFFKLKEILQASELSKDELKRKLEAAFTLAEGRV